MAQAQQCLLCPYGQLSPLLATTTLGQEPASVAMVSWEAQPPPRVSTDFTGQGFSTSSPQPIRPQGEAKLCALSGG